MPQPNEKEWEKMKEKLLSLGLNFITEEFELILFHQRESIGGEKDREWREKIEISISEARKTIKPEYFECDVIADNILRNLSNSLLPKGQKENK